MWFVVLSCFVMIIKVPSVIIPIALATLNGPLEEASFMTLIA